MRWLISVAIGLTVSGCAVSPTPSRVRGEPMLRVGLVVAGTDVDVSGANLRVSSPGAGEVQVVSAEAFTVVPSGERVRFRGRDRGPFDRLRLTPSDRSGIVRVDGTSYRGAIEIYARHGSIYAVNEVGLETYLMGVVSREMGSRNASERAALEAQAIVSRTYALKNRGRFASDGYDVRAGTADQVYGGVEGETALGNAAVRATAGLVITYAGELISPFFHSTCGGTTAGPEEAFRTVQPLPYLDPVSDRRPGGGYYCDRSPHFAWEVEWEGATLRDILRRTLPSVVGIAASHADRVRDVMVYRSGRSGRASEIRVGVEEGEIPIFGPDVRRVFQTPTGRPLGSTAVRFEPATSGTELVRLKAVGSGWGHGVGMCQWGAIGRARAGRDARSIVSTYFRGGRIEAWY